MLKNKSRIGLYGVFFRRLEEVRTECDKEIIPFPKLFRKICRNFCLTKKECWDVLFLLRDFGIIKIVPGHGIKVQEENFLK